MIEENGDTQHGFQQPQLEANSAEHAESPSSIMEALNALSISTPTCTDSISILSSPESFDQRLESDTYIDAATSSAATNTDRRSDGNVQPSPTDVAACLVVLQKACDHHKFSRKLRQRDLVNIVERPERTEAALLGIISAKAQMELSNLAAVDMYECQREGCLADKAVIDVHGSVYPQQLLHMLQNAGAKLKNNELEIPDSLPIGDLYLAERSLEAINGCLGALYDGIDNLMAGKHYKRVHVCLRPPGHHAGEETPCGFCWINNAHIAISYAREKYNVQRTAILDFDLHHGDGSQSIAWQLNENQPFAVGYFSLHDIYSFPCESGSLEKISDASVSIAAHGHTIHNVHLQKFDTAEEFEDLYTKHYSTLLHKAEDYLAEGLRRGEKCLVCISAGYDASEYESANMQRHSVNLPTSFYERFTRDAVRLADMYCAGKVLSVMEGGYGSRAITASSAAHMIGLAGPDCFNPHLSACYDLEHLKILEKNWPIKPNTSRKSGRVEFVASDKWFLDVQRLHSLYVADVGAATKLSEEQTSSSLQKMTLRDRKPRMVLTKARSAKSTPHKPVARTIVVEPELVDASIPQAIDHNEPGSDANSSVSGNTLISATPPTSSTVPAAFPNSEVQRSN